jgi:hypothetical protein
MHCLLSNALLVLFIEIKKAIFNLFYLQGHRRNLYDNILDHLFDNYASNSCSRLLNLGGCLSPIVDQQASKQSKATASKQ